MNILKYLNRSKRSHLRITHYAQVLGTAMNILMVYFAAWHTSATHKAAPRRAPAGGRRMSIKLTTYTIYILLGNSLGKLEDC